MVPEKEVRICDLCGQYYPVILEKPDYEIKYLDEHLDLCNNCYDEVTRCIQRLRKHEQIHIKGGN